MIVQSDKIVHAISGCVLHNLDAEMQYGRKIRV